MPLSPLCLVSDNGGPFNPTTGGVNVAPGDSIAVQLAMPGGVGTWYLTVYGTDELSTPPTLANVNPSTGQVTSPTSIVTFTYPGTPAGRSIVFQSTVVSGSNTAQTTFSIYSLTPNGDRVGAVGETREGNVSFGWAAVLNPIMRQGAAYLYYNDGLATPATGANNIQGAIDFLKGHSAGITLENDGSPIANNPHNTLNLIGLTAADNGDGEATLTVVPGINLDNGTSPIAGNPHTTLQFYGITAADLGSGVASLTVPLPSNLNISGQAQGDILYFNGTTWVRLPAGTAGEFLETLGVGENPEWSEIPSASVTGTGLWYSAGGVLHSSAVTLGGDVSPGVLSGDIVPLTVTGILDTSIPGLTTGFLYYNGTAFSWSPGGGGGGPVAPTLVTMTGSLAIPSVDTSFEVVSWYGGGSGASITNVMGGIATITGINLQSGPSPNTQVTSVVGLPIRIITAHTPANNGTFITTSNVTALVANATPANPWYKGSVTGEADNTGSIAAAVAGVAQFTDTVGGPWSATDIGNWITITGAASANNNGTFQIVSYTSATQIGIANSAATSDGNNGSLVWTEYSPTLTGNFTGESGSTGSIAPAVAGVAQFMDTVGGPWSLSDVGRYLLINGSASNNGVSQIVSYTSATQIGIAAPGATSDANNGSLGWLEYYPVIQITTTTPNLFVTGDYVDVTGIIGTTEANFSWQITTLDTENLTLNFTNAVNAYISGGFVLSTTSINYSNSNAVAPDASNGSIQWSSEGYGSFPLTLVGDAADGLELTFLDGSDIWSFNTLQVFGQVVVSGSAASIVAVGSSSSYATVTGLTGITPEMVGQASTFTISGAASSGNNGVWSIVQWISATSIQIEGATTFVAPDAHNGSLSWAVKASFHNPTNPGATSTEIFVTIQGSAFTIKWSAAESEWLSKSVAFGYTAPFFLDEQPWLIGDVDLSGGGTIGPTVTFPVPAELLLFNQPSSPATTYILPTSSGNGFITVLLNQGSYPITIQNENGPAFGSFVLNPGFSMVVASDSTYIYQLFNGYDSSQFQPSIVAPATFIQSQAGIQPFQTTSGTQTATFNFPLPGTTAGGDGDVPDGGASPITSLPTPGLFTLDVSIRLQDTTQPQAAWWKYTWGASVQTVGDSVNSLGTSAVGGLAIGTNSGAPPSGWGVVVQFDGEEQYIQVIITGDPTNTCNGSIQWELNNTQ